MDSIITSLLRMVTPNQSNKKTLVSIQRKIDFFRTLLMENNYPIEEIYTQELVDYFEGEAPSGDTVTLDKVLLSKWLLIHEIIELNELKKMGFKISGSLLFSESEKVFHAHLTATEWELDLAFEAKDFSWIATRLIHVKSWLEDSSLSKESINRCKAMLVKYSSI